MPLSGFSPMLFAIAGCQWAIDTLRVVSSRGAMRFSCTSRTLVPLIVIFMAVVAAPNLPASRQSGMSGVVAASTPLSLDMQKKKADALVQVLPLDQALGPLAPIALSPFFALTCLSGASIAADSGLLPDALQNNALLGGAGPLNNGAVFSGLLALTLLTAAPKLTKVTKPFAQAIDQVENYSGIIAVLAVQGLSQFDMGSADPDKVAVVYQAGIFTFSYTTLLMAFSAINLFVVNTVKFFFEVLVLLSPFPFVDALFEAMNKAFVAFLMAVYLFSPWVAMILNLGIFLFCLIIFAWVFRRVIYMRSILGEPFFGWVGQTIFRMSGPTIASTPLPGSIAAKVPNATVVLRGFSGRSYQGLKRKMRGYLVQSEGRLYFAVPRFLRSPLVVALPFQGHTVKVDSGLLSNTISIENDAGDIAMSVLLTRRYNSVLNEIRKQIGGVFADRESSNVPSTAFGVGRSLGAAVKGTGREQLRGDLA